MENKQVQNIKDLNPNESLTLDKMPEDIKDIQAEMDADGKTLNWMTSFEDGQAKSVEFFLY